MGLTREDAKRQVGEGWGGLLDRLYDQLKEDDLVIDVKEKWGGLRVYLWGGDEKLNELVDQLEKESLSICEWCGAPGILRSGGWIRTLCEVHAKELGYT